jgi:hypothetical protein
MSDADVKTRMRKLRALVIDEASARPDISFFVIPRGDVVKGSFERRPKQARMGPDCASCVQANMG